jgi:hypothetical protein
MAIKQHHALFFLAPLKGWRGAVALGGCGGLRTASARKNKTIKNKHDLFLRAAVVLAI